MTSEELKRLADIELKHIQVELENGRGSHLRHFIDQYFCFKHNYISVKGNPRWEDITWKGAVSISASKTNNRKDVVKEHLVPLQYIRQELLKLSKNKKVSINEIEIEINRIVKFGTVLKSEDKILNALGLRSKMPKEFYDKNSQLFNNLYARYIKAGIKYKVVDF